MKIRDCYKKNKYTFSFEFFPPKNKEGERNLFETIRDLKSLSPSFVSVTYGAMGNTQNNTLSIVEQIKSEIGIEVAAHLTCIAHSKTEIETILESLQQKKIENIVALRGDIPKDEAGFKPKANGFKYANELVRFIRQHPKFGNSFSLAVAGYPETHPESKDPEKDLQCLKQKVDEGADVILTQLFFNNRDYFQFVNRCRKIGIQIPIVPGIMPITNGSQIQKFTTMCGASLPREIRNTIERYGEDNASIEAFGIEYGIKQCRELIASSVPGIHFYTLNKSRATREIYTHLNVSN